MILEITRGRSKQPWRWKLRYDNDEPASNSGESFPDERCVARAVYRYLQAMCCVGELHFRGHDITRWWVGATEAAFVRELRGLIREQPEGTGVGGKGRGK